MSKLTRRQLLIFFGSGVGTAVVAGVVGKKLFDSSSIQQAGTALNFTPVRLPHPLPIYQQQASFIGTGVGQGETLDRSAGAKLDSFTVVDDVVVPPEYERYVIVRWGDRIFPNQEEYFGYNNDYTAFVPVNGSNPQDGYLWVNHESVSFPFSATPDTSEDLRSTPTTYPLVIGQNLPDDLNVEALGEFLYNMGGSVLRVAQENPSGRFVVRSDGKNRRIHGLSGLAINRQRSDKYQSITAWGSRSYQKGDNNYLVGTGPAAIQVFNLSADGLGNQIVGTAYNCSGGTTPWGTVLTAEENFQGGVTEAVKPDGTQTKYTEATVGATFGLVGEKYGWMVELDPANPQFRPRKHTYLGRFRHENITLRVEPGRKLVAYMGDDRRGGHTWKYVSSGTVTSPESKANSALLEDGTLFVARYNPDKTGTWIPLCLDTGTNPISPSTLASVELAALGEVSKNGSLHLPSRKGVADQTEDGGPFILNVSNQKFLSEYQNKQLRNFYPNQGAILSDAFLAANLAGGTPTARPEDLEVHPRTREVFIAYTDGAPDDDGYPDSRVFTVSKYTPAVNAAQQSGGLYKIVEESPDATGTTFGWERLAQGGEAGADTGAGFANVDNLVFDSEGNVWGVTDMSTSTHNGLDVGATGALNEIDHTETGNVSKLTGVFGNNWLFYIPTSGPNAGAVIPFAYGPVRCEMTGPTFVGDTLILSVQHPGEDCPINDGTVLNRNIEILDLTGSLFKQLRSVPRGSSWPSNIEGNPQGPPRPSVIGIRRKESSGRFV